MKKTIYILRHGETDFNRMGRVQGSGVDTDLNSLGRQQAQAFFEKYQNVGFQQVITSGLKRTWQTVDPFIQAEIPWEVDQDLNEVGWGVQEGKKSTPESREQYLQVVDAWSNGNYQARMPEGESAHEFGLRLQRFVDKLEELDLERLLICSHGRAMRALMCLLHRLPLSHMQEFQHNNTGLWIYHYEAGLFDPVSKNDLSHLQGWNMTIN